MIDVEKFLNYYYPDNEGFWTHERAQDEDRFQDTGNNEVDCGYHLINFMEAACKNVRIFQKGNDFIKFKERVEETIASYRRSSAEMTEEMKKKKNDEANDSTQADHDYNETS